MARRLLFGGLILGVLLAGCSNPNSSGGHGTGTSRPGSGSASGAAQTPSIDLHHGTAAPEVASDTTVTLSPKLYADPGNPCASVEDNSAVTDVDPACALPYIRLGSTVAAGAALLAQSTEPASTRVQRGVDPARALALGNGFFVTQALRSWAISLDVPQMVPAIDGPGHASDLINAAISVKPMKFAYVRPCTYPTTTRVVTAGNDVQRYMRTQSWPDPSNVAVVSTYGACDGITVTFTDGTTATVLDHTQAVSIVTTGAIATVSPFGPIFVQDGWAPCAGQSDLKSVCG